MKRQYTLWCLLYLLAWGEALPASLLYEFDLPEAEVLPKEDDVSSEEIKLKTPIVFYGVTYNSVFVNSNGFISFQTEIPSFINVQFPLDYPIIAPFYSNVDTTGAGAVYYQESKDPAVLRRATDNIHDTFSDSEDFEASSVFVVTWQGVGYSKRGSDKINTYQIAIATDGVISFVEFLYPENGIQWLQGTGDESGLPDARPQAGLISADGKVHYLPGSGTEQVKNLEKLSNMKLNGQFIYRIDERDIIEPDLNADDPNGGDREPLSCSEVPSFCHIQAQCLEYQDGICCQCNDKYYGNGKHCIKKDAPLRVNGKVDGRINGERLENLDLQSYIVMTDGRAYTAISKIPESIGFDIQSLQILGGVIGYLFAKPIRGALNGYQLTGGVFNQSATITFQNTSQQVKIRQKFHGLDVFDQLRLECTVEGEIPTIPNESKVSIDEYEEQYTLTKPGVIQMRSSRKFKYIDFKNREVVHHYTVDQSLTFDQCKFENSSVGLTWRLKVGKNFISYEAREQIIRFGLSNKITPFGDFDPCEEGRSQCGENSACIVENDSFRCVCVPGYQQFYTGNETICADINECQIGQYDCDANAQCVNLIGSYHCQCNPGFEGDGRVCENAKSCANIQCLENAECVEANQVANCRCLPGFTGNGQNCYPITAQSCHLANNCSPYGLCELSQEAKAYRCSCLPGYEGDGYSCYPAQVPSTDTPPREIQRCLLGVCWCPEGYKVDTASKYCISPDEQRELTTTPKLSCRDLNNCHRDAQCVQEGEGFACVCNEGFEGDGYNCEAERESCTVLENCSGYATCTYLENLGKSKCICNEGFVGDGYTCNPRSTADICITSNDCSLTEECALVNQRHECICRDGYTRDSQHQCIPSNGICGGGVCVENADCLFDENVDAFYCSCRAGFIGDGITECKPKPVGCDVLNNCGVNAQCQYNDAVQTYQCRCRDGFQGDGFVCYTERTCIVDPKMCDVNANCVPTPTRSYVCQCRSGFIGNGTTCKEIQTHEGNFLLVNYGMATLRVPTDSYSRGKPVQLKTDQTAVGLDIDCLEGKFYWSDINGRAIKSAYFNGTNQADFINIDIGSPEGISIDWVSRNIYWTDSTKDTIEVANIDSKRRKTLFDTGLVNPRGIAVHPQRGKIFWTDWDRKNPKIEWANADGTGRQVFLQGRQVSLPSSLAIDFDTEQICYADAGTKKIECVQIDSRQVQTIAVNCSYPFGITVTDKQIFWSDWITKKIDRVDKYSLKRLPPINVMSLGGGKLFELVAVPMRCPALTNVCERYSCPEEHICLPNGAGSRRCVCAYKANAPHEATNCIL